MTLNSKCLKTGTFDQEIFCLLQKPNNEKQNIRKNIRK